MVLQEKFEKLPSALKQILKEFTACYQRAGWECFLVGGSCRDLILGETPTDFDFATNCPLEESRKLFKKVIPTGEAHGTLTIIFREIQFEVTRYRLDVETDGRHAVVEFAKRIEDDLKRRDLRVNAIAFDPLSGRVVDSEKGLDDFYEKRIRFVGRAAERVCEDHLRAIRYCRFISRLRAYGFTYDAVEMEQVVAVFDARQLALERIYDEFKKMFRIPMVEVEPLVQQLTRLNLFQKFRNESESLPELLQGILLSKSLLPLAFQYGKNCSVKQVVTDLKLTRCIRRLLPVLYRFEKRDLRQTVQVKRFLNEVQLEDYQAHAKAIDWLLQTDLSKRVAEVLEKKEPYRIAELKITGKDLKQLGIRGPLVGKVFSHLLQHVWEKPFLNSHSQLREMAVRFLTSPDDPAHQPEIRGRSNL